MNARTLFSPARIPYLPAMILALASPGPMPAQPSGDKPARTDRHGDPLPPGAIARIGTIRFRTTSTVYAVSYSPNGKLLAAIGADGVRVWDAATGKLLHRYTRRDAAEDGAFPPAGYDRGFFAPDGRRLWLQTSRSWTNSPGNELFYWELTPKPRRQPKKAAFAGKDLALLAASPDGKTLAITDKANILICEVSSGREKQRLQGGGQLFYSADGKLLAGRRREGIVLWNAKTGEQIRVIRAGDQRRSLLQLFALSPDGKTVAALLRRPGASVRVWNVATGEQRYNLPFAEPAARAMAFSPNGKLLAVAGLTSLRVWDVPSGKMLWEQHAYRYQYFSLAFSPDSKTLAAGLGGEVLRYDSATGRELSPVPDGDRLAFLTLLADGRTAVSAGSGEPLRLWRLPEATEIRPDRKPLIVPEVADVSLDGKWMASRSHEDRAIHIWDIASGKEVRRLSQVQSPACSFSPDRRWMQTHAYVQNPNTGIGGSILRFWDLRNGKMVSELKGDKAGVAVFSPDSRMFAVRGAGAGLWVGSVPDGAPLRTIRSAAAPLTFSADGRLLATVRQEVMRPHLWEIASGKEIVALPGKAPKRPARFASVEVAFSPDGRKLVVGDLFGLMMCWDVEGRLLHQWRGDDYSVFVLRFTPDGKRLLSGGHSTALLWNMDELLPPRKQPTARLTDADLNALWSDLKDEDATRAYRAVWKLADAPEQAVPFLRQKMQPAREPDQKNSTRILRLIRDLDNDAFAVREKASRELAAFGREAEPALREALTHDPSAESKRRIEDLLRKLPDSLPVPPPERLRSLRAVAVLEYAGNEPARQLLKELSQGHAEAQLTRESNESLTRLLRRAAKQ